MKNLKSKKITKNGSITLPKEMRTESGLLPGVGVDIEQNGDTVVIKPHVPTCRFCEGIERVTEVMGITVCSDCAAKIYEKAVNGND